MRTDLVLTENRIPSMTSDAIGKVYALEAALRDLPQVDIPTDHVLHGGMYSRTICIPAGVVLTGVLIGVPTLLVIDGDATVNTNDQPMRLTGHHVLPASAGRRQAFVAHADTHLTMLMATNATSVSEAEVAFTDEVHLLASRDPGAINRINITGE